MNPTHNLVLSAIQAALREEKESGTKRWAKILASTAAASLLMGLPFLISFRTEMTWIWNTALAFWVFYFLIGFYLLFRPQPRLMVSGVFSPFVIARLFLVSTFATIAQIIICPSFVFLSSSFGWNPLAGLTDFLMRTGGMNLCMGFCGFLFSTISASLGIHSVHKAAKGPGLKSSLIIFSILLASQLPVLFVQVFSEDLRPFLIYWILGVLAGFLIVLGLKCGVTKIRTERDPV